MTVVLAVLHVLRLLGGPVPPKLPPEAPASAHGSRGPTRSHRSEGRRPGAPVPIVPPVPRDGAAEDPPAHRVVPVGPADGFGSGGDVDAPAVPPAPPPGSGADASRSRESGGPSLSSGEGSSGGARSVALREASAEELERDLEVLAGGLPEGAKAPASPKRAPSAGPPRRSALPPLPPLRAEAARRAPKRSAVFVVAYRVFGFRDRLGRDQTWHAASLEAGLLRRYVRLGLLTEVGVEGGAAADGGDRADFAIVQKVGLGAQYPHFVTPFVEVQGGAGLARVELFERNDLAFLATVGVEGGAQWALGRVVRMHLSVGWVRPYLRDGGGMRHGDSATFRVGMGF